MVYHYEYEFRHKDMDRYPVEWTYYCPTGKQLTPAEAWAIGINRMRERENLVEVLNVTEVCYTNIPKPCENTL